MMANPNYKTTLAPELLRHYMASEEHNEDHEVEKSEIFSVAMLVVSSAFGEDFREYYNYDDYKVNYKKLYERMDRMINIGYDRKMCELIVEMLDEAPKARPDFEKAHHKLEKLDIEKEHLNIEKR